MFEVPEWSVIYFDYYYTNSLKNLLLGETSKDRLITSYDQHRSPKRRLPARCLGRLVAMRQTLARDPWALPAHAPVGNIAGRASPDRIARRVSPFRVILISTSCTSARPIRYSPLSRNPLKEVLLKFALKHSFRSTESPSCAYSDTRQYSTMSAAAPPKASASWRAYTASSAAWLAKSRLSPCHIAPRRQPAKQLLTEYRSIKITAGANDHCEAPAP